MIITYLQQIWLDETYYTGTTDVQRNYWHFDLPTATIKATISLTIYSQGHDSENVAGFAAAGIKSYEYIDNTGKKQHVEMDHWQSHLTVKKCTQITFALDVVDAWAGAVGMIYYLAEEDFMRTEMNRPLDDDLPSVQQFVYDTKTGDILHSYRTSSLVPSSQGTEHTMQQQTEASILREAATLSKRPIEQLGVLTIPPGQKLSGAIHKVDVVRRTLVTVSGPRGLPHP